MHIAPGIWHTLLWSRRRGQRRRGQNRRRAGQGTPRRRPCRTSLLYERRGLKRRDAWASTSSDVISATVRRIGWGTSIGRRSAQAGAARAWWKLPPGILVNNAGTAARPAPGSAAAIELSSAPGPSLPAHAMDAAPSAVASGTEVCGCGAALTAAMPDSSSWC